MTKPSIALIMSKSEPKGEDKMDDSDESDETTSEEEVEVDAMRMFEKASSPEQKAEAMKMFLKACGAY